MSGADEIGQMNTKCTNSRQKVKKIQVFTEILTVIRFAMLVVRDTAQSSVFSSIQCSHVVVISISMHYTKLSLAYTRAPEERIQCYKLMARQMKRGAGNGARGRIEPWAPNGASDMRRKYKGRRQVKGAMLCIAFSFSACPPLG